MRQDMRGLLNEFTDGLRDFGRECPDMMQGFMNMLHPAFQDGAVSTQEKEFIAVALSVYSGNEHCIAYHVHKALEEGATSQQILEAASVAVAFGGGPAMSHVLTCVKDAIADLSGVNAGR